MCDSGEGTMKLLIIGDIHFTHEPPRARTDQYPDDILRKLAVVAGMAGKVGAAVACTGDIFHRKAPEERDITALIRAFKAMPGGCIYSVLGNHDTGSPGRMDGTAYECLVEAGVVQDISDRSVSGAAFALTGRAFRPEPGMAYAASSESGLEVVISHGMLVPEDRPYPFAATFAGKAAPDRSGVLLVNGHNHGAFDLQNVVNLGSLCRLNRGEAGPRRILYVNAANGQLTWRPIDLRIRPDDDVFCGEEAAVDLEAESGKAYRDDKLASFVEAVAQDALTLDAEELLDKIGAAIGKPADREEARRYIREAKERLKA